MRKKLSEKERKEYNKALKEVKEFDILQIGNVSIESNRSVQRRKSSGIKSNTNQRKKSKTRYHPFKALLSILIGAVFFPRM